MDSLDGELLDGPLARLVFIYVGRFFLLVVVFFWGGGIRPLTCHILRFLSRFTGLDMVLAGFTHCGQVEASFHGLYLLWKPLFLRYFFWVLPSCTGFYLV